MTLHFCHREGIGAGISAAILNDVGFQGVTISFVSIELGFAAIALVILYFARRQTGSYEVTPAPVEVHRKEYDAVL